MAVEPLYCASLDELLLKARIKSANDDQTVAMVHQTVTDVRIGFYSQLGRARAQEIRAIATVANPETDDDTLKQAAVSAEVVWMTVLLIQRLPLLFMDNAGSVGDAFNDEPLTRDAGQLKDLLDELKAQLSDLLGDLADENSEVKYGNKANLNGPDTTYLLSENRIGNPVGC